MGQLEHESELHQSPAGDNGNPDSETSSSAVSVAPLSTPIPSEPKRPKSSRWLFRGLIFGVTAAVSTTLGAVMALVTPLPQAIAPQGQAKPLSLSDLWKQGLRYHITRPVNILVMGIDLPLNLPDNSPAKDVFSGRSDTMLLVHVDPDAGTVNVLSIPRDTQVEISTEGLAKINYANVVGGSKLAAQVVSSTLNGVPIDRYVRVSTAAFREMVDLLGGIRVLVPERMAYTDETQHLKIDLQPGWQTLNGEQAEQFARFRNDGNGDIGRVQRQQQLIRALREKLTDPTILARVPQAVQLFEKYIDTNLNFEEMVSLVNFGLDMGQENFRMVMLPGRFSRPDEYTASYWIMDSGGKDQVMQEYFDVSSVATISQQHDRNALKIAIQNASDNPRLASQVAAYLQAQGFNNVYVIQDWPDQQHDTQIIVQKGDLQSADALKTALGVGEVVPASTGDIASDLTIRVGEDWSKKPQI